MKNNLKPEGQKEKYYFNECKRLKAVIKAAFSFGIGQEQHKTLKDEVESW